MCVCYTDRPPDPLSHHPTISAIPHPKNQQVTGVRFATDRETGEFRGFGHVDFAGEDGPEAAVAMAGTPVSLGSVAGALELALAWCRGLGLRSFFSLFSSPPHHNPLTTPPQSSPSTNR